MRREREEEIGNEEDRKEQEAKKRRTQEIVNKVRSEMILKLNIKSGDVSQKLNLVELVKSIEGARHSKVEATKTIAEVEKLMKESPHETEEQEAKGWADM